MFGLLFIAVAGHNYFSPSNNPSTDSSQEADEKAMAITMAQNFVRDNLKSPSSASFPWAFSEYRINHTGNQWSVTGTVEAVNSFNAKLKQSFSVVMRHEGANWKLLSINIGG